MIMSIIISTIIISSSSSTTTTTTTTTTTSFAHLFITSHVEIWKDALSSKQKEPYLSHHFAGAPAARGIVDLFLLP